MGMTASVAVAMPLSVWVMSRMRRFGTRSATAPACRPNSRIGPNWSAMVTPTAVELWVRLEHHPVGGDALHPRARVRRALPADVDPVAARGEGCEGASRLPNCL